MPIYFSENPHPGYIAARRYPLAPSGGANVAISAVDVIYFLPFMLMRPLTFTGMSAYVVTGGAASSMKLGIWANSPISMRPLGAPLFKDDTGVATATGSTTVALATGTGTLGPGMYWAGSKFTGTLPTMRTIGTTEFADSFLAGASGSSNATTHLSYPDAYANANPTIAEGSGSFAMVSAGVAPVIFAVT